MTNLLLLLLLFTWSLLLQLPICMLLQLRLRCYLTITVLLKIALFRTSLLLLQLLMLLFARLVVPLLLLLLQLQLQLLELRLCQLISLVEYSNSMLMLSYSVKVLASTSLSAGVRQWRSFAVQPGYAVKHRHNHICLLRRVVGNCHAFCLNRV